MLLQVTHRADQLGADPDHADLTDRGWLLVHDEWMSLDTELTIRSRRTPLARLTARARVLAVVVPVSVTVWWAAYLQLQQRQSDAQRASVAAVEAATLDVRRNTSAIQIATELVHREVAELAETTARAQRLAVWVGVVTAVLGAVLGGFAGAFAARLLGA